MEFRPHRKTAEQASGQASRESLTLSMACPKIWASSSAFVTSGIQAALAIGQQQTSIEDWLQNDDFAFPLDDNRFHPLNDGICDE
jgi:hypothetical protein